VLRRLGVIGLVGLVGLIASGCSKGEKSAADKTADERVKQARDVARKAGLEPQVQDFLALYASAAGSSFSVNYEPSNGSTVVLIQDPPQRRVDVVAPPVTRSVFVTKTGTYDCSLQNQQWACQQSTEQQAAPGLLAPEDITRTAAELTSARTNYTFKIENRTIAKTTARCLLTTPKPGVAGPGSTLCLSPEGAVLLVEGTGNPLKAAEYSTKVDERRLELPTKPEPPPIKP